MNSNKFEELLSELSLVDLSRIKEPDGSLASSLNSNEQQGKSLAEKSEDKKVVRNMMCEHNPRQLKHEVIVNMNFK